jgi:hypothetical protein
VLFGLCRWTHHNAVSTYRLRQGCTHFPKARSHLKILDTRRCGLHSANPWMWATAIWRPGFWRPIIKVYYTVCGFSIPRFKWFDGPWGRWVFIYFGVCICGVEVGGTADGHYRLPVTRFGYNVTCRCTLPVREAFLDLMFVLPYILVTYMFNSGPTRCTIFFISSLTTLALHVSGAICTHHQEHNCSVQP